MTNVFLNRYQKWGNEIDPQTVELIPAIRVNTLKVDNDTLVKRLSKKGVWLEKVPFLKNGFFYTSAKFSLGSTPEYLQGYYYLQDAASQVPAQVLDPKPGDIVLDMAAAPGGKTTQLSSMMKNKGIVIALDVKRERITGLKNNIERMGCSNVIVYNKDALYASDLGIKFDKVILDAPCSGNFCIDPEWFEKRNLNDFQDKAKLQKKLLKEAINVLKPGGEMVYSTCSMEIEEDEEIIEWALDNLDVELLSIDLDNISQGLTERTRKTRRFWPDKTKTQGFFVAKLKKK